MEGPLGIQVMTQELEVSRVELRKLHDNGQTRSIVTRRGTTKK